MKARSLKAHISCLVNKVHVRLPKRRGLLRPHVRRHQERTRVLEVVVG
jgi:hypothetical protein